MFLPLFAVAEVIAQDGAPRTVAVADIIALGRFGSQPVGWPDRDYAVPSPDGARVAAVVQRGNLIRNTVDYVLLVFPTADPLHEPHADTVAALASSSNRPGIAQVTWLGDNATLAFLGEHAGEIAQVYTVDTRTHAVTRRTSSPTPVSSFAIAASGDPIIYTAEVLPDTSDYPTRRARGFIVQRTQFLGDLVAGQWAKRSVFPVSRSFIQSAGGDAAPLPNPGPEYAGCNAPNVPDYFAPSIAPDGTLALVYCAPRMTPALWRQYTHRVLQDWLFGWGYRFAFPRPMLVDLRRNTMTPLIDAPVWYATSVAWAPDSHSVVLANTFLPLGTASTERAARARGPALAEVDLQTHEVTVIAERDSLRVLGWDPGTNTIELAPGTNQVAPGEARRLFYRRYPSGWKAIQRQNAAPDTPAPRVFVDEGMNVPPRLVVTVAPTGPDAVVYTPDPELLSRFRFARESILRWRTKDGVAWTGGLYYPPGYTSGRRYPLVIQTHGLDSTRFWPEGASATGYAAQALAAHGILVLQLDGPRSDVAPSSEGPAAMAGFESAVSHLDSLGLIDRAKVGLMGWSRTCYYVKYALTHSRFHFAAATISDGIDFSYLSYLFFELAWSDISARARYDPLGAEAANGGRPWGRGLETWRARAPGFNLDRVATPLHITTIQPVSLFGEWEVYAGLALQRKPVEMLYLPEGAHGLVRPLERLTSEQVAVDWFRFWLSGEQDADPAKTEQYARWRELRRIQQQQPHTARDTEETRNGSK